MTNLNKPFHRLVADEVPCVECGRLAVVGTQQFKPDRGAIINPSGNVTARARVELTFTLCFHCGRRERWAWLDGKWQPVEVRAGSISTNPSQGD